METAVETNHNARAAKQRLTPANVPNNRQELRPLPLRVSHAQYDRLDAARLRTGISIQEHVRRGIDLYLAVIEREAIELGLMPERPGARSQRIPSAAPGAGPAANAQAPAQRTQPRVEKR